MDGDLGAMLSSVLSDPEQMAKLGRAAQSLMSAGSGVETPPAAARPPAEAAEAGDGGVLSALGRMFAPGAGTNRSTALLVAMRPYMRPEKQEKLDRAMKIAQMARIAGAVIREYGGGHGV